MRTTLGGLLLAAVSRSRLPPRRRISRPSPSASSCRTRRAAAPIIVARIVAQKLQEKWGQPVVVENRAGAGGNLGAEAVYTAAPDGYTLLFTAQGPLVVNKSLYGKLNYDPDKFTPVSLVIVAYSALLANPKVPAATLPDADRLRQGQSRQAQLRVAGHRHRRAPDRRTVQLDGRGQDQPCARIAAAARRSTIWLPAMSTSCSASSRRRCRMCAGQAQGAGGEQRQAARRVARRADRGGIPAGLRRHVVVGAWWRRPTRRRRSPRRFRPPSPRR